VNRWNAVFEESSVLLLLVDEIRYFICHSRGGGNPDSNDNLKTNKEIIDWIPAFAGMTQISEWELKKMAFKNSSHFKFIGVHF